MPADLATPVNPASRRRHVRDAFTTVAVTVSVLLLLTGPHIRSSGQKMDKGPLRSLVLAVGTPAGWVAELLPFAALNDRLVAWVSPDDDLSGGATSAATTSSGESSIGPESFDPAALGQKRSAPRRLRKVLVTGDSMAMPLDTEVARRLTDADRARTIREPHVGTGISKPELLNWNRLAERQVHDDRPEAVVVFIGANEGFPMTWDRGEVECCTPAWAAAYADAARRMMSVYRQGGAARVYWLTLPMPRDEDRRVVARAVNAAIRVAAAPWRTDVRILDMEAFFTPGGNYRDSLRVAGREQLVREPDGIHLSQTGARLAADRVLDQLTRDFPARD